MRLRVRKSARVSSFIEQVEVALPVARLDVREPVERVRQRRRGSSPAARARRPRSDGSPRRDFARLAADADDVAEVDVDSPVRSPGRAAGSGRSGRRGRGRRACPCSRRAMTRPARRRVSAVSSPGSSARPRRARRGDLVPVGEALRQAIGGESSAASKPRSPPEAAIGTTSLARWSSRAAAGQSRRSARVAPRRTRTASARDDPSARRRVRRRIARPRACRLASRRRRRSGACLDADARAERPAGAAHEQRRPERGARPIERGRASCGLARSELAPSATRARSSRAANRRLPPDDERERRAATRRGRRRWPSRGRTRCRAPRASPTAARCPSVARRLVRSELRAGAPASVALGDATSSAAGVRRGPARRRGRGRVRQAALMSMILNLSAPRGAATSTVSPFLLADDRLADRRLVRELVLGRVRLGRADDVVLDRLVRVDVPQPDVRADRDDVRRDLLLRRSRARCGAAPRAVAIRCSSIACSFFASSYSAFSAMSPNSRATRIRSATSRRLSVEQVLDLLLQLLVALGREDDFLQRRPPDLRNKDARRSARHRGREW